MGAAGAWASDRAKKASALACGQVFPLFTPSRIFAENARKNPESSNLNTIDSLLLIGGGVPVKVGDEVIGAIGVGGAGGSVIDESCALEALHQVLDGSH